MTREIKFRGKRIDTGEWVYGDILQWTDGTVDIAPIDRDNIQYTVNPDTVGQYTGLKDRNGKEVYEGDIIVQQGYSGIRPMLVKFEAGAFVTGEHHGSSTARRPMLIQRRCVIVGNRWDNPELLEDGE